ncbi:MAG: hypothetical protein V4563_14010 [Pseudomonadota bacterium]
MSTQPFTCFACGDGNTPLYCLNCAERALESNTNALLRHVWNHMHGQDMDGTRREFGTEKGDAACAKNWNKLSDMIGLHLPEVKP